MSFDLTHIARAVAAHGPVARVVVARVEGSAPREIGAAMLVWQDGQDGTIGGGALELQATETARAMLTDDRAARLDLIPLGPAVGQCCGGAVSLVTEVFTEQRLAQIDGPLFARAIDGPAEPPLSVQRLLANARSTGTLPGPQLMQGWMIEPLTTPQTHIWVWGAGHVGRAIVAVLAPLPDVQITWVDTAADRFPDHLPENVDRLIAPKPAEVARYAPADARHLILTYSHPIDLSICDALLRHDFGFAGLIGSTTKRARFRRRLTQLGHGAHQVGRITCPIGDPGLGKHPQAIAIGVAAEMLKYSDENTARRDATA